VVFLALLPPTKMMLLLLPHVDDLLAELALQGPGGCVFVASLSFDFVDPCPGPGMLWEDSGPGCTLWADCVFEILAVREGGPGGIRLDAAILVCSLLAST
jgi:hypothetical protein